MKKNATETFNLLREAYGSWVWMAQEVSEGRNDVEDVENVEIKMKTMSTVFFNVRGIIMVEYVPQNQTVNHQFYIQDLTKLRERIRKKRPDLWSRGWILHHDNAPAHNAISVRQFLARKQIPHAQYSLDLAPCDFFYFPPKLKSSQANSKCRLHHHRHARVCNFQRKIFFFFGRLPSVH